MNKSAEKKAKETKKGFRLVPKVWSLAITGILFVVLFFVLLSIGFMGDMPNIAELENPKNSLSSEVYTEDGKLLGKYFLQNRTKITYDEIPKCAVDALVSTEDERFYEHSGIDARSMGRAVKGMGKSGGASTITQQLAKNLFSVYEPPKNKITRIIQKLKEWVIAVRLEKRYSKDEIITMYFNTVPFTNLSWGLEAATKEFYNKKPLQLKVDEAAILVGMLKANTMYNPKRNPENSKSRRNTVLGQMKRNGKLTDDEYAKYSAMPIKLDYHKEEYEGPAAYFRDYLAKFMKDWCKKNGYNLYQSGLKIYTTLDYDLQMKAEAAVKKHMVDLQREFLNSWGRRNPWTYLKNRYKEIPNFIEDALKKTDRWKNLAKIHGKDEAKILAELKKPIAMSVYTYKGARDTIMSVYDSMKLAKKTLHAGFIAITPQDGFVKAWVGGINHEFFKYDHVNIGVRRQVGSTFKPLVYATVMDINKTSPCSSWPNAPVTFGHGAGSWTPGNGGGGGGSLSMADGLAHSNNFVTARLMKSLGPNSPDLVAEFAERVGIIKNRIPRVPSICLGTVELSPFEMAGSFIPFVNKGLWIEPTFITRIEDANGNIVFENNEPRHDQVLSEEKAYLMFKMLTGVVSKGTGKRLIDSRYGLPELSGVAGGKTGTTQGSADGWFMGLSRNMVCATWVGADDPSVRFGNGALGQGAHMALPIYAYFIKSIIEGKQDFKLDLEMIDKPSGNGGIMTDCGLEVPDEGTYIQPKLDPDKNENLDLEDLG